MFDQPPTPKHAETQFLWAPQSSRFPGVDTLRFFESPDGGRKICVASILQNKWSSNTTDGKILDSI